MVVAHRLGRPCLCDVDHPGRDILSRSLHRRGAGDVVQGFDPDSGQRLWTVRSPGEGVVPSIVCGQDLVFTSSGYGAPTIRAIRPDGHDDVTSTHIAWESRDNVPLVPSFLYADGLLFCTQESGIATCRDAKTGRALWKQRLQGTYGASPVLAEGRLYCLAEDGSTIVIAADREFRQLARNPLEGPCKASPAISNGRIFIRSQSSLFCIRQRNGTSPAGKDQSPCSRSVSSSSHRLYASATSFSSDCRRALAFTISAGS